MVKAIQAGMAGLGTLATPVIGVLTTWVQFGEQPAPLEAAEIALIGIALSLLAVSPGAPAELRRGQKPNAQRDCSRRAPKRCIVRDAFRQGAAKSRSARDPLAAPGSPMLGRHMWDIDVICAWQARRFEVHPRE